MAPDTISGATVIIDLGVDRGEPETYSRPTRPTTSPWFPPAMVALLVLVCAGGSAAPPAPPLEPVFSVPVGPADAYAVTDSAQLLAQTLGTLQSYDLADGRLRWSTTDTAATYRLRTGADLVLVRPWSSSYGQPRTTALSLRTGAARWRHAGRVVSVSGTDVLLATSNVRSSGPARRVQGPVESLDPRTGAVLWRVDVPSTAVLLAAPGHGDTPPRMLLVHDNRTAAVHDLATGRMLATGPLPPANYGGDNPVVVGGMLLLRHPGADGPEVSAYDPQTLQPRWRRPAWDAYEIRACGNLACLAGPAGVRALDPATGVQRWHRSGWRDVEQRGDLLIAYSAPTMPTDPIGVVDPRTGRLLVDLAGWRLVGGPATGDHLLVTRVVDAGAATLLAVAAPGNSWPQPLSELPPGAGDCQAAAGRLICRSGGGELRVWAYRQFH
ncbi:outer membrane protein assembly factor BamB family protein [Mangrovihabitans endophyticus]|uniref:Pyrrolo-quinoline quinone repeat domain-containing protein n=1 Tax=Mangrovihabitans endophyticus TaxID=1751298 RepID=A0A8J3FR19_9ACTN|nr:PQQ-binding-like beta-propeller repeat protein [Mangrovihabitans endophyticus]GGL13946.1 hypothetical protein GCM10012284_55910 [Mangrovihabitans endophyticus]